MRGGQEKSWYEKSAMKLPGISFMVLVGFSLVRVKGGVLVGRKIPPAYFFTPVVPFLSIRIDSFLIV